jgi:transcriptional regulator with XRE-family HTH domain
MDALIATRLRELRSKKGLSRSQLSLLTVRDGYAGVPESTIKAIETKPGRVPEAPILEALARALGEKPEVFYEFPIAAARTRPAAPEGALGRDLSDDPTN